MHRQVHLRCECICVIIEMWMIAKRHHRKVSICSSSISCRFVILIRLSCGQRKVCRTVWPLMAVCVKQIAGCPWKSIQNLHMLTSICGMALCLRFDYWLLYIPNWMSPYSHHWIIPYSQYWIIMYSQYWIIETFQHWIIRTFLNLHDPVFRILDDQIFSKIG